MAAEEFDLLGPAHLTLERGGLGRMSLLAIEAGLDYRVVQREGYPAVESSFDGSDQGDRINGRGSAVVNGDRLQSCLFIHHGDDSDFTARRTDDGRTAGRRRRR